MRKPARAHFALQCHLGNRFQRIIREAQPTFSNSNSR